MPYGRSFTFELARNIWFDIFCVDISYDVTVNVFSLSAGWLVVYSMQSTKQDHQME